MRRLKLKISDESRELAEINYREDAREISGKHHEKIRQLERGQRGGAIKTAIDNEYYAMAQESAEAWLNRILEQYAQEGLIPDFNEINDMGYKIEELVESCTHNPFYIPTPDAVQKLSILPLQIHNRLKGQVRKMEIESRRVKTTPPAASGGVHIQGENIYNVQVGGQNNTQYVTINDQLEEKVRELLSLVENSSLSAIQKLKAINDIRAVHELSRIGNSPEVVEEARTRLDGVTSVISLSADLVSLGMPIIQMLRAFFGI